MAAFCHPREGGSRFSSGDRGAWYAARAIETAIAESRVPPHGGAARGRRVRDARADARLPCRFQRALPRHPRRAAQSAGAVRSGLVRRLAGVRPAACSNQAPTGSSTAACGIPQGSASRVSGPRSSATCAPEDTTSSSGQAGPSLRCGDFDRSAARPRTSAERSAVVLVDPRRLAAEPSMVRLHRSAAVVPRPLDPVHGSRRPGAGSRWRTSGSSSRSVIRTRGSRGSRFRIVEALLAATVVSVCAEATQLFSTLRFPSATDVIAAMAGAAAGAWVSQVPKSAGLTPTLPMSYPSKHPRPAITDP